MTEQSIAIEILGEIFQFNTQPLPSLFLEWQSKARIQMFEILEQHGAGEIKVQPAHIAVMATMGVEQFPINLASRGMGLLPKPELVKHFINDFNQAREETESMPIEESLPRRVEAMRSFYCDPENFDNTLLGGLEIFEGHTARNLENDPRAALLYAGEAPTYPSFQFNGVVRRVDGENIYFRFLLAARELFAMDQFHIHQTSYPFGYIFQVVEIKDKTPYPRR